MMRSIRDRGTDRRVSRRVPKLADPRAIKANRGARSLAAARHAAVIYINDSSDESSERKRAREGRRFARAREIHYAPSRLAD